LAHPDSNPAPIPARTARRVNIDNTISPLLADNHPLHIA